MGVILYYCFTSFVIVGTSNAVNLTDGLDGLAIVPVMIAIASFGIITYLAGNLVFSEYLGINFIPFSGELSILCCALLGSCLGFLWFNAPPAMIFMGDTGSLSLGAILASIAIITKHELVLIIIGGIFVLEAMSVIIQVFSYKVFGKRVFTTSDFARIALIIFTLYEVYRKKEHTVFEDDVVAFKEAEPTIEIDVVVEDKKEPVEEKSEKPRSSWGSPGGNSP